MKRNVGTSMMIRIMWIAATSILFAGCAALPTTQSQDQLVAEVTAAEVAFAKTMVDRDYTAFMRFVAEDAIFLNAGKPLRGKAAIGEYWKGFYTSAAPPFTWKPDLVEVLPTGTLAQSVGPVAVAGGKIVSRFYSTWRRDPDGSWRVVFDDGYDVCDCPSK